ncbi:hypothetical protein E2C01_064694 [Portunus trituberculatus]|uniref:Uncharacterized protein n=1 Tax=Portunus trituberculatus TaxID=210409 RepID=A0A5B7HLI4_PORTR|nr:hypothetical protein [Portunus trituberculatus]
MISSNNSPPSRSSQYQVGVNRDRDPGIYNVRIAETPPAREKQLRGASYEIGDFLLPKVASRLAGCNSRSKHIHTILHIHTSRLTLTGVRVWRYAWSSIRMY